MEDSKILWYIVLGAIYFLSKIFGKKKKQPEVKQPYSEEIEEEPKQAPQKPQSTSFDDILKELSKEVGYEEEKKPVPEPITEEVKPLVSETTPLPSYPPKTEAIDHSPITAELPKRLPIEREKPEYKRSAGFEIVEEDNEIAGGIRDLLTDVDGPKKAIILSEILNRKYR